MSYDPGAGRKGQPAILFLAHLSGSGAAPPVVREIIPCFTR
jgi:hypothetical protein